MQRALPQRPGVIDGDREVFAWRAQLLFDFSPPGQTRSPGARRRDRGDPDWEHNEFRALLQPSFADYYLYVSRDVDGKILSLLDDTQETVRLYQQLEADRGRMVRSNSR